MQTTNGSVRERVAAYYAETTVESYLVWGGSSLALHLGVTDGALDADDRGGLDRATLAMNALLADRAAVRPGDRVLDAGCGVGGSSIWLARERGARVLGVTLDPGQVELARRFAAERGATTASFARADYAATGLPEGTFDVVWNLESLCHAADPEAYLAHVRGLLADGGRFVCADFFRGVGGPDCEAMCDGWVLPSLRSARELADALSAAGFADVNVVDITPRVRGTAEVMAAVAFHELLRLGVSVAQGAPRREAYEAHFRAAMAATAGLARGEVTYGLVSATRPAR